MLIPAVILSIAWTPYVIIFARSSIAFGNLGAPAVFPDPLYWLLLALQLFVCVISHSLALRTMIGLYAPLWLIIGSLALFCLSPIWGMLVVADVRYPLFAMMVCVLTSSVAFIVYSKKPTTWLWIELGLASILVCLLRATGFWSVLPVLVGLLVFQIVRDNAASKSDAESDLESALNLDVSCEEPDGNRTEGRGSSVNKGGLQQAPRETHPDLQEGQETPVTKKRNRLKLGAGTAAMISVLIVVCGTVLVAALLGFSEPLGEPPYTGVKVAYDVALEQIESTSLNKPLAVGAARSIMEFQQLPLISISFTHTFYVVIFALFLLYALVKRDWRALLVGMPQIAIFALSIVDPSHCTLAFVIPAMAAQIMFFGATLKGTNVIGEPPRQTH